jgi:hypothetical protein
MNNCFASGVGQVKIKFSTITFSASEAVTYHTSKSEQISTYFQAFVMANNGCMRCNAAINQSKHPDFSESHSKKYILRRCKSQRMAFAMGFLAAS